MIKYVYGKSQFKFLLSKVVLSLSESRVADIYFRGQMPRWPLAEHFIAFFAQLNFT